MNLLFDIGHPGQVHLLRNAISILKSRGHEVTVTVKEIPNAKSFWMPMVYHGYPWGASMIPFSSRAFRRQGTTTGYGR